MCRVGQRCASHGAEQLEKAESALKKATQELATAKKTNNVKIVENLQAKVLIYQENVNKAQHHYDSTKTGMKKLQEQGFTQDDVRMKRANLQNIFGKTVLERKKSTGSYYPTKQTITL